MKIFEKMFAITKQEDGSANLNIAISDSFVITKVISKNQAYLLKTELDKYLEE